MDQSLFEKIYSYRERENKSSLENFLIEIFAFCLTTDKIFFANFLSLLDIRSESIARIQTQSIYEYGRPDIEINFPQDSLCILIECKVEHFERPNQLEDYKKILNEKSAEKKHLVYLTKYYENRENLHLIRWMDIYGLISTSNTEITQQLKIFLKENGMAESKNFNYKDMAALLTISDTITKMDEVLDNVKDYYQKKIGDLSRDAARSTGLGQNMEYVVYHIIGTPKFKFSIDIGFYWWDDWGEEVFIAIMIYLPLKEKFKNSQKYKRIFDKNLKTWWQDVNEDECRYWYYKAVASFITNEDEQIPAMVEYLMKGIDELNKLKTIEPRIFK